MLSLFLGALFSLSTVLAAPQDKLISDDWYTVTVGGKIHYEYYNERVELRKGRLYVSQKLWKKEDDFINEEQMGAFAENNPELTPLFFNFHSTYRTTETTIDGSVDSKRILTAKIRKASHTLPVLKKSIPSRAILSSFFTLWMNSKIKTMKVGETASFLAILEDNIELAFSSVPGRISLMKPDDFSQANHATKIAVNFNDLKSVWYLDKNGAVVRTELSQQNSLVQRVSEEKAKHFLD